MKRRMFGLDLDAWNLVMLSSLAIAALVAGAVVASTAAVVALQKQDALDKAAEFERYRLDAAAKLTEANTHIHDLDKEAADARERAAKLENDASQARLEQERLKSVVQWRQLSNEDSQKLHAALEAIPKSATGPIIFSYEQNNDEAEYYLFQIGRQFWSNRGWQIGMQYRSYAGMIWYGVRVLGPDNETTRAIRAAFNTAGIEFSTDEIPGGFTTTGVMASPTATVILVGPKKPPFDVP
jgi:hypothetical protein